MRRGLLTCLLGLILGAFLLPSPAPGEIVDRIVATVNGEIITLKELNDRLLPVVRANNVRGEEEVNTLRREILERLIDSALTMQQGRERGIIISDADVDDAVEHIKSTNNLTQEQLEAELRKEGISQEAFREDLRTDLVRARLLNREIRSRVVVPAEQVDAYLKEHQNEFNIRPQCHLRNILISLPEEASSDVVAEKKALAEKVFAEIQKGLDFEKAAAQYSEAGNAAEGGDMGTVTWDDLAPPIREALEKLEEGQVSRPVQMPHGFMIFQLVALIGEDTQAAAQAREKIREMLTQKMLEEKFREWIQELRSSALIKVNF